MKTSCISCTALCLLMSLAQSGPLQAQFFKDILNTVKQTAQGRANSKASETTNKALDKVDSSTKGGKKTAATGTNGTSTRQAQDTATTPMIFRWPSHRRGHHRPTPGHNPLLPAPGI